MAGGDDDGVGRASGVDPRFDPRFQRGWEPADVFEPEAPGGGAAPDPVDDPGVSAEWDAEDEPVAPAEPAEVRRVEPAGIALLVLGLLMVAAGIAIVVALTSADDAIAVTRTDRLSSLLLSTAPTPLITVGCLAAVLGLALTAFAPRRGAAAASDPVPDDDRAAD